MRATGCIEANPAFAGLLALHWQCINYVLLNKVHILLVYNNQQQ